MKISLCTVVIDSLNNYLELMIQSALNKLNHLYEIVICDINSKFHRPEEKEKIGNVIIRRISMPVYHACPGLINSNLSEIFKRCESTITTKDFVYHTEQIVNCVINNFGHALGLHECIDNSKAEYIMFCDPDVIFYTAVDDLYLNFMKKYNLNYIGCAHESANKLVYGNFPYLANSLVKKSDLPNVRATELCTFLQASLYFSNIMRFSPTQWQISKNNSHKDCWPALGKYLIRGAIPELVDKFEIPPDKIEEMDFDTGCNLYLWGKQQNWQWLSFLSYDCQNYKTSFYRSNFNLKDKLKSQKLIYHQWGRYRQGKDSFQKFQQVYQESKELEYGG